MYYRYNKERDAAGLLKQDGLVLELLLQGKTRMQISKELGMPMGTLNTCCARIYRHTDCHSVVELILKYDAKSAEPKLSV